MKRILCVLLVLVLALGLSGCCLKHDMQPATCTEPSTCSKCGKTEGEPLGHTEEIDAAVEPTCTETGLTEGKHCSVCGEVLVAQEVVDALGHTEEIDAAVEPTCTETGLTEGKHCSVCGEVLVAQEVIDALGHDWEEATFMTPKTCSRCGETEGEALGSEFFVQKIFKKKIEEEQPAEEAAERSLGQTKADEPFCREYLVTASTYGLDAMDERIANSSIRIVADTKEEGLVKLGFDICFDGSEPLNVLVFGDDEGLSLYLPGTVEEGYRISYETLKDILQPYLEENGIQIQTGNSASNMLEEVATPEELRELGQKYVGIILGTANLRNTGERLGAYQLQGLGKEQKCLIISCRPELSDWQSMLRTLFTTAKEDEKLQEVLAEIIRVGAQNPGTQNALESAGIGDPEELIASIPGLIDAGLQNVDEIANALDGFAFEVAMGAGRVHAVRLTGENMGFGYESCGSLEDGRDDALVLYSGDDTMMLARNTVQALGETTDGQFTLAVPTEISLRYVVTGSEDRTNFDIRLSAPGIVTMDAVRSGVAGDGQLRLSLDLGDFSAVLQADETESDAEFVKPEVTEIEITGEDDFSAMAQSIAAGISETDLAQKVMQ